MSKSLLLRHCPIQLDQHHGCTCNSCAPRAILELLDLLLLEWVLALVLGLLEWVAQAQGPVLGPLEWVLALVVMVQSAATHWKHKLCKLIHSCS
jgi:hypothetical protein